MQASPQGSWLLNMCSCQPGRRSNCRFWGQKRKRRPLKLPPSVAVWASRVALSSLYSQRTRALLAITCHGEAILTSSRTPHSFADMQRHFDAEMMLPGHTGSRVITSVALVLRCKEAGPCLYTFGNPSPSRVIHMLPATVE